ncbi:23S rRNA (pseudouridine(1915)-N(3))-methyltransferase RlmH [Desulfotruncus arcticus]|uniref:23S rRNA (pseudouridine(1915)-N(3))-methyltransferase RlmH n=1 Tax=Desulfotruncus arcticus TaxID=341036 RepID=UPI000B86246F|nr:23S rRNA (pseudouridine(1915)-N(3))-methyltransferase RlmH [Desulfotruncus arcticus]
MKITVLAVGKLKEKYWRDAIGEYAKRLRSYCNLELKESPDESFAEGISTAEEDKVKAREWQRLIRQIRDGSYVIALDVQGEQISSPGLAARIEKLALDGQSDITFLIGGTLGLPGEALQRADWRLSFSKMTFPHQLMRVILLEQIYRAFKISKNEPYHR